MWLDKAKTCWNLMDLLPADILDNLTKKREAKKLGEDLNRLILWISQPSIYHHHTFPSHMDSTNKNV
jgi:hypothetical protein